MDIQIFGKSKCFDTKKAERYFKERGIRVQLINILEKPPSPREMQGILQALGGADAMINTKSPEYSAIAWLADEDKAEKLCELPQLFRTPIVRNGKYATAGYAPEVWRRWEQGAE